MGGMNSPCGGGGEAGAAPECHLDRRRWVPALHVAILWPSLRLALPWETEGGWHVAGSAFPGCAWILAPDPPPVSAFQNQGLVGFPPLRLHVPVGRHADLVSLRPPGSWGFGLQPAW